MFTAQELMEAIKPTAGGYVEVPMNDVEFAEWLKKDHKWKGDYYTAGKYVAFMRDTDMLCIVKYRNEFPCDRWIYVPINLVDVSTFDYKLNVFDCYGQTLIKETKTFVVAQTKDREAERDLAYEHAYSWGEEVLDEHDGYDYDLTLEDAG